MKRFLAAGALVASVAAAVFVARADAILFGTPDKHDHPGVGYTVFYDSANVPVWRCTASLVSTRVLLTAGHCAGKFVNSSGFHTPVRAQVWFDDKAIKPGNWPGSGPCDGFKGWPCSGGDATGAPIPHPAYQGDENGTVNDIGVVVLTKQQKRNDVLDLAPVGTLDAAHPRDPFTIVGYGDQSPTPPPVDQRQRMQGTIHLLRTEDGSQPGDDPQFADFTNFQAAGAAACVGDSGGPVLDGNGDVVAVIALLDTSPDDSPFGDDFCQGIAFHYRTDTADSQLFLARFGVRVGGNGHDDGHHHGKHGRAETDD